MIKDSGKRQKLPGMVRDTSEGKIRYNLIVDGPMFDRWAKHLMEGAKKYTARNWMGAHSQEELNRFVESAFTHFIKWLRGEVDEDHAAAVFFNINGAEYVKERLHKAPAQPKPIFVRDREGGIEFQDRRVADRRKCHSLSYGWSGRRGLAWGRRKDDPEMYPVLSSCDEWESHE